MFICMKRWLPKVHSALSRDRLRQIERPKIGCPSFADKIRWLCRSFMIGGCPKFTVRYRERDNTNLNDKEQRTESLSVADKIRCSCQFFMIGGCPKFTVRYRERDNTNLNDKEQRACPLLTKYGGCVDFSWLVATRLFTVRYRERDNTDLDDRK